MSHIVLEKYRSIAPVTDDATAHAIVAAMTGYTHAQASSMYARSERAGRFYLVRHESAPGKVLEVVPDENNGETMVITLYEDSPIFVTRQSLIDVREEIIGAIDHLLMSVPNSVVVHDAGRNKDALLRELGTAQLLDVLTHFDHGAIELAR